MATLPALQAFVAELLGLPVESVPVAKTEAGQPVLTGRPGHVSIAHSGSLLALAYGTVPIGIDLEVRRRERDWLALAGRYLHTSECRWVATQADPGAAFLRLWVAKEALLKAMGLGIANALSAIELEPQPDLLRVLALPAPWSARDAHVSPLSALPTGVFGALAHF